MLTGWESFVAVVPLVLFALFTNHFRAWSCAWKNALDVRLYALLAWVGTFADFLRLFSVCACLAVLWTVVKFQTLLFAAPAFRSGQVACEFVHAT
jgi:hypothetical protein